MTTITNESPLDRGSSCGYTYNLFGHKNTIYTLHVTLEDGIFLSICVCISDRDTVKQLYNYPEQAYQMKCYLGYESRETTSNTISSFASTYFPSTHPPAFKIDIYPNVYPVSSTPYLINEPLLLRQSKSYRIDRSTNEVERSS